MKKPLSIIGKIPKKFLIIGAIILIIVGFFLFKPKNNEQRLQFTQVKRQDIKSTVSSSGSLTGKQSADLKFKSGGKLAYISVKAGDMVSSSQTMAGLDTESLRIDLQQAQNTLREKQAIVDKILDDVKDHSSDETFTQRQTRTTAEVARDNAYDGVKAIQKSLQDITLISPISGVVTTTSGIAGQNVSASDTIAQVVDFSEVFLDSEIDEADVGKITLGQKAEITLDAFPQKTFDAVVEEIVPQIKTTSTGANVVTVRIKINSALTPINGLSGQATIILSEVKNALTIPIEALADDGTVFVQNNQNIIPKKVVTGIKSDTDVEIQEGLDEKDKVLLNPPQTNGANFNQNRSPLQNIFPVFRGRGR